MIKILFFLSTLGNGGAEKVLVNLVNHMDTQKFDITVMTLFDEGENKEQLAPHIKYLSCIKHVKKGLVQLMKCLTPKKLHDLFIKDYYDIEVSYLEGIATRIISGCRNPKTKKIAWIHTEFVNEKFVSRIYRSFEEARNCYAIFDKVVCVSEQVRERFCSLVVFNSEKVTVQYNTIDSDVIRMLAQEKVSDSSFSQDEFKVIAVGKIIQNKGFDRLARVLKRLVSEDIYPHIYIVGAGEDREKIEKYLEKESLSEYFTFIGYRKNPYQYINKCNLFVCSSYREGFSTATTEALILGIPVLTVDVSGMRELLGNNNEYGVIVSNDEESLYQGLKDYILSPELQKKYKAKAEERGKRFNKDVTVKETEKFFELILEK